MYTHETNLFLPPAFVFFSLPLSLFFACFPFFFLVYHTCP